MQILARPMRTKDADEIEGGPLWSCQLTFELSRLRRLAKPAVAGNQRGQRNLFGRQQKNKSR